MLEFAGSRDVQYSFIYRFRVWDTEFRITTLQREIARSNSGEFIVWLSGRIGYLWPKVCIIFLSLLAVFFFFFWRCIINVCCLPKKTTLFFPYDKHNPHMIISLLSFSSKLDICHANLYSLTIINNFISAQCTYANNVYTFLKDQFQVSAYIWVDTLMP